MAYFLSGLPNLGLIANAGAALSPLLIAIGAVAGAWSRYGITLYCTDRWGGRFPYGTFVVNLSGAFLIGVIVPLVQTRFPPLADLLVIGFLGAYTTFSTYMLDTINLFRAEQRRKALIYWLGSAGLGLAFAELGLWLGNFWRP
ncbi:MAG TPA: fluoride efflux transporter CrcB [Leptolyngbyaceae cyanobacterium M33_DOE_097]|uniref:Fluoride-specific ion channel FluC n=1 Tax=Oscillatoriales cyanobacterium SpSt-418 TaxID=2282169 RepID=A0A7C3KHN6_9CYAN|nr:fluoride efflux transporter CrcB [Leptolyngbyaceae cyanobacterium M33_DOE_097]